MRRGTLVVALVLRGASALLFSRWPVRCDLDGIGDVLKPKTSRLASRRRLLYEDLQTRKAMAARGEVYSGDGLFLDSKLEEEWESWSTWRLARRLGEACDVAVQRSTGNGTESSGEGRYSWGTWVDVDYYAAVKEATADARLFDDDDDDDEYFWERFAGSTLLARGERWSATLRVLDPRATIRSQFPAGSHVLLRPLYGTAIVQKLRKRGPDDFVDLGRPRKLSGATKTSTAVDAAPFRLLGGPPHALSAAPNSGRAAVLEVVLRPPTGDDGAFDFDSSSSSSASASSSSLRDGAALLASQHLWDASSSKSLEEEKHYSKVESKRRINLAAATKGSLSTSVGGLEKQLDALVRRVLASRSDPVAAKRLGVDHVRGVLLSGPPGCGKTLLARELARELGAREPQIVNGPEILDKFVGEAERKVRALFEPAEDEFSRVGDASALHVIILDEMDAVARKRGSLAGDTTGVRDGVVNTLLAKMDGVNAAPNVLVVGLTNRPELIDPALKRPGRLEVQISIERPDRDGRRQILRIHTRAMRENDALSAEALAFVDGHDDESLAAKTDDFSGAELAGLVRSAASFALGRRAAEILDNDREEDDDLSRRPVSVTREDLEAALAELGAAAATDADAIAFRFADYGVHTVGAHAAVRQRLLSFINDRRRRTRSVLLLNECSGCGASSLAAWTAVEAKKKDIVDFADFVDAADPRLFLEGTKDFSGLFDDATQDRDPASTSLVVLDDLDGIIGRKGDDALRRAAALRALLTRPPKPNAASLVVVATSTTPSHARLFDAALVVERLSDPAEAKALLRAVVDKGHPSSMASKDVDDDAVYDDLADALLESGPVDCKFARNFFEQVLLRTTTFSDDDAEGLQTPLRDVSYRDLLEEHSRSVAGYSAVDDSTTPS